MNNEWQRGHGKLIRAINYLDCGIPHSGVLPNGQITDAIQLLIEKNDLVVNAYYGKEVPN